MEKLSNRQVQKIKDVLNRWNDRNIAEPVQVDERGLCGEILKSMEEYRQKAVYQQDAYNRESENIQRSIANITHDLKTPLALLLGYAECLEDGMDDKNYPVLMQEKIKEMNEMVLHIIDSARSKVQINREGKRIIHAKKFFTSLSEEKERKSINLTVGHIPDALLYISEYDVKQALRNLVRNAVQHSPENGRMRITFRRIGNKYFVMVKDHGEGIKKEYLPHIFEQFFTGDPSRATGSSGVGLYAVQKTMEQMGGKVAVRSKEGKGSTFILSFPVYRTVQKKRTDAEKKMYHSLLYILFYPFMWLYETVQFFIQGRRVIQEKKIMGGVSDENYFEPGQGDC